METEPHPQATEVLDELKKFSDVLEGAMRQQGSGSFAGKDAADTVEVVINGDRCITELNIEDGLLRLGADTVQERINEALLKANAAASAALDASFEETFGALSKIVEKLSKTITEE